MIPGKEAIAILVLATMSEHVRGMTIDLRTGHSSAVPRKLSKCRFRRLACSESLGLSVPEESNPERIFAGPVVFPGLRVVRVFVVSVCVVFRDCRADRYCWCVAVLQEFAPAWEMLPCAVTPQDYLSGSLLLMGRIAIRRRSTCGLHWLTWSGLLCAATVLFGAGCHTVQQTPVGLPTQHAMENEHLLVRSDLKLPKTHPILQDLDRLRDEIAEEQNLPVQKQPVTVYLFSDEVRYAQYLQTRYPLLPPRRAYFVGTPKELAVYTFWGDRIQEDLRHEYTHGVLHASLVDVPLWLDEGLAEYFEVTTQPKGLNRDYVMRLASNLASGWKPDLDRLESLEKVEDMQKGDYLEAWAWVHFLLHHSEETRMVLVDYLRELRTNDRPDALSKRLRATIPTVDRRFASHAASLTSGIVQASSERDSLEGVQK